MALDEETQQALLQDRFNQTVEAVLYMLTNYETPKSWRDAYNDVVLCPYCGLQYLNNESRLDITCAFCHGSHYFAEMCCDMLDFLLANNDFYQALDKDTRDKIALATQASWYGFEFNHRNRAANKKEDENNE